MATLREVYEKWHTRVQDSQFPAFFLSQREWETLATDAFDAIRAAVEERESIAAPPDVDIELGLLEEVAMGTKAMGSGHAVIPLEQLEACIAVVRYVLARPPIEAKQEWCVWTLYGSDLEDVNPWKAGCGQHLASAYAVTAWKFCPYCGAPIERKEAERA